MGKKRASLSPKSLSGKGKKQQLSSLARHGKMVPAPELNNDSEEGNDNDDSDDDSVNATGYMSLEKGKKKGSKSTYEDDEDDDEEEEVFDLGVSDSDGGDDDDDDEDEYEEGSEEDNEDDSREGKGDSDDDYYDDDDDDYHNYADDNMKSILENLPVEARNKILSGKKIVPEDDIDDDVGGDSDEENEDEGWGKKKSNYYSGDTADLEIGQDVQDAEDEEEAVKELHEQTMKKMTDSDYYDDLSGDDDDDDDDDEEDSDDEVTLKKKSKVRKKTKGISDKLQSELQTIALGSNNSNSNVQIEKIERNVANMTKDQKLAMITADSPELLSLVEELKEKISELKHKIIPIRELEKKLQDETKTSGIDDDIIHYLDVKNQMLIAYCLNLCFYLAMRCEGKSVKDHPVMRQLLELRYVMEKLRPMDGKLKHQIDRLVNAANVKDSDQSSFGLRPNPNAFIDKEGASDDSDSGIEDSGHSDDKVSKEKKTASSDDIYRPPKIAAAPYRLEESREDKEARKLQRKRNKLKNSAIFESLQEEFGSAPEQSSSTGMEGMGTADAKALQKEIDERNKFEEERMIRLTMTRKEKQSLKRRQREANKLDRLTDLGDIGGLDEFDDLKVGRRKAAKSANAEATAEALKKAVAAFAQSQDTKKVKTSSKKSNKAIPDFAMDEIDVGGDNNEFDGIVEDFSKRKKDYETKRAEKYVPEPRYGGLESHEISEGQRRPATYEMIKNRGLTPHRKKANRNPRVKKREAYAKAVKNRRGQVRDVITGVGTSYDGEWTGIKSSVAKSRKIGN